MEFYTLKEANANVDLLQKTFDHLATLYKLITDLKNDSYVVLWEREKNHNKHYGKDDGLDLNQLELNRIINQIEDLIDPIIQKGIIVRDIKKGLVDIPSIKEGRIIYLCWVSGETEVSFWREIDAGFSGRQLI